MGLEETGTPFKIVIFYFFSIRHCYRPGCFFQSQSFVASPQLKEQWMGLLNAVLHLPLGFDRGVAPSLCQVPPPSPPLLGALLLPLLATCVAATGSSKPPACPLQGNGCCSQRAAVSKGSEGLAAAFPRAAPCIIPGTTAHPERSAWTSALP